MSPLALAQRFAKRQERLNEAQMAHLRHTAYRGVDTSAHLPPNTARRSAACTYRGVPYKAN